MIGVVSCVIAVVRSIKPRIAESAISVMAQDRLPARLADRKTPAVDREIRPCRANQVDPILTRLGGFNDVNQRSCT